MGSPGSRAASLRRSSQSWRTGLGGAGCCADAVSGKAAAALPRKAMNSRLLIVASLIRCGDLISSASIARRQRAAIAACVVRKEQDAPLAPCDKGYTRRRCSEREDHDEQAPVPLRICRVVRLRW